MNEIILSGVILEKNINKDNPDWVDVVLRVLQNDVEDEKDKKAMYVNSKYIAFSVYCTRFEKSISYCRVGNYIELVGTLNDNYDREKRKIGAMKIYPRRIRKVARK